MNHSMRISASAVRTASLDAWRKLAPMQAIKSPVMFVVWVGTVLSFGMTVQRLAQGEPYGFALCTSLILFFTVWFANFAEAIAEARGKAQADSLRKTREETPAKLVKSEKSNVKGQPDTFHILHISSSQLKKGDIFVCEAGDLIAADGEIIEGLATIDESAITGESAPVIREAGGDKSSVTGGTKVLSDFIKVKVTKISPEIKSGKFTHFGYAFLEACAKSNPLTMPKRALNDCKSNAIKLDMSKTQMS